MTPRGRLDSFGQAGQSLDAPAADVGDAARLPGDDLHPPAAAVAGLASPDLPGVDGPAGDAPVGRGRQPLPANRGATVVSYGLLGAGCLGTMLFWLGRGIVRHSTVSPCSRSTRWPPRDDHRSAGVYSLHARTGQLVVDGRLICLLRRSPGADVAAHPAAMIAANPTTNVDPRTETMTPVRRPEQPCPQPAAGGGWHAATCSSPPGRPPSLPGIRCVPRRSRPSG